MQRHDHGGHRGKAKDTEEKLRNVVEAFLIPTLFLCFPCSLSESSVVRLFA